MKSKNGQVTIFIIVGVLILVLITLGIIFLRPTIDPIIPENEMPLNQYVTSCIKQIGQKGAELIGIQGGYFDPINPFLNADYSKVAYHIFDNKILTPSIAVVENELDTYIKNALDGCLGNFSAFETEGFDITTGELKSKTKIREEDIQFTVEYPVTLKRGDSVVKRDEFIVTLPLRLKHVLEISRNISERTLQDPDWIDMTFLSSFDVDVDLIPVDDNSQIYEIKDTLSQIEGNHYTFLFAHNVIKNQPPILTLPTELRFKDSTPATYKVEAIDPEDDDLEFTDDTAMFDITPDGIILFTPELTGSFDVMISVKDSRNNKVSKVVTIIIE